MESRWSMWTCKQNALSSFSHHRHILSGSKRPHPHKDPTDEDFLESPSYRASEQDGRILMLIWPFRPLSLPHSGSSVSENSRDALCDKGEVSTSATQVVPLVPYISLGRGFVRVWSSSVFRDPTCQDEPEGHTSRPDAIVRWAWRRGRSLTRQTRATAAVVDHLFHLRACAACLWLSDYMEFYV